MSSRKNTLQFEYDRQEETTRANLNALYGVERAPCDTRFRERLDALDPSAVRPLYKTLAAELQRGKGLEKFTYLDVRDLLSIDGTGDFSSQTIHCAHIRHLQGLDLLFILGAEQGDHTFLFDWVVNGEQTAERTFTDENGFRHRFRFLNGVPLNDAKFDLEVNVLEYWEHAPDGSVTHHS